MTTQDPKITIEVTPEHAVRVDENHGGYMGGECIACGARGWLAGRYGLKHGTPDAKRWCNTFLVHTKACPVNEFASAKKD